jgi:hypothetical protein
VPATTTSVFDLTDSQRVGARGDGGLPVTTTTSTDVAPNVDVTPQWYRLCPEVQEWVDAHPGVEILEPQPRPPVWVQTKDNAAWVLLLPRGVLSDGSDNCRLVIACALAGGESCMGYVDPDPPDPSERGIRIIFEQCNPEAPIHAIQIIYCCP